MSDNIINAPMTIGGNAIVGNGNSITQNIINGLDILLNEYKEQLTKVSTLLNEFKPKTSLNLLQDLENRIRDKEIVQKELLTSKIFYLKGLCKSEISIYKKEDAAIDFIQAYSTNKNDNTFRDRACLEYLNLEEYEKADVLADEILNIDEFNITAWYVKCILSENLFEIFKSVPKILQDNIDFTNSLIFKIIRTEGIDSFDVFKTKYNIEYKFDINDFKEITFLNKTRWTINIDLLINKFFTEFPLRYIAGDKLIVENNFSLKNSIELLDKYVSTLDKTEISDSIIPYKFYNHYLKYLTKNENEDYKALIEHYNDLHEVHWSLAVSICQVLNHNKKFEEALIVLNEYLERGGEDVAEYYIFRAVILNALEKYDEVDRLFLRYLDLKDSLDERSVLNIFYTFFNIQKKYADRDLLRSEYEKMIKKSYSFPELKELVKVTLKINFLDDQGDDVKQQLLEIDIDRFSLIGSKTLIARNFESIGLRSDAIKCLEAYVDKTRISEELRLYIYFLIDQLYDKNDTERRYKELLELLEFWRKNNDYVDESFLLVEHNLYMDVNDLDNLEIIDEHLYRYFPENDQYLFFILSTLEKKKNYERISNISSEMKLKFEDEILGVNISILLLRNKINPKKAFLILFNLAQTKTHISARRVYFTHSFLFSEYLKTYEEARIGNWVVYKVDNITDKIKITRNDGLQGKFIGKKNNDKFIETSKISGINKPIEILEIYNDAMKLFRDITEEAHNPINELGFESMNLPSEIEDFEQFLINKLGAKGSEQEKYIDENLNDYYNYKKGFIEIAKSVFNEDFIDAYNHLTLNTTAKYTTLPSAITDNNWVQDYGLDFSTLLLFYYLDTELDFRFTHKFKISYLIKSEIERKIQELRISPVSTLSVNITMKRVEKFIYPDNINEIRIEFLEKVLLWANNNCIVDNVVEKLELYPKLREEKDNFDSDFTKILFDLFYMSSRENFRLISSDSFLFSQKYNMNVYNNMLNPEKYLKHYFPEKCDELFYRQLLKWHYVGIDINLGVLKNEFFDFLAGKSNYYSQAIENLRFSINPNTNNIYTCSKFLKEIYLMNALTIENKNIHAFEIFASSLYYMPKELIGMYEIVLKGEFKLLGDYYDMVLKEFNEVKKLYSMN
ncbi:hypothetical protein CMT90_11780 [Elizabethkingia anophelis]|nr:hypothetical protein [Elizabethkingia anophelis]